MKTTLRLVLFALGCIIGWSAFEHWLAPADLIEHYRVVGIGERGRVAVATLQSLAAVGLLVPRLQVAAALVFATVMTAIAAPNLAVGGLAKAAEPLLLALWALLPVWGLSRRGRSESQSVASKATFAGAARRPDSSSLDSPQ